MRSKKSRDKNKAPITDIVKKWLLQGENMKRKKTCPLLFLTGSRGKGREGGYHDFTKVLTIYFVFKKITKNGQTE